MTEGEKEGAGETDKGSRQVQEGRKKTEAEKKKGRKVARKG